MKRKILNSLQRLIAALVVLYVLLLTSGCVSFDFCKADVCASGTSFLRPLSSVTATIPRDDDGGEIEVEIIYSKDQVSLQGAAQLINAAKPGGG